MHAKIAQTDPDTQRTFRKIFLRSSAYAIAAYFISIISERIMIIACIWLSGYSFELTYNEINIFALPYEWNQETVLLIYLVPFLFQAIVAVVIYVKFDRLALKAHYSRIFMLWVMFFIAFRLLGIFPSHILFETGIYHALHWLYLGIFYKLVFGIIAVILFLAAGYQSLKGILMFAGTYNVHIRDMGVPNLVFSSIVYPIFSVCIVSLLFFLPEIPWEEITGLVILILLSIYLLFKTGNTDPDMFSYKENPEEKTNPVLLISIILASVAILRILLGMGIIGH
jgi:hypothetical protein